MVSEWSLGPSNPSPGSSFQSTDQRSLPKHPLEQRFPLDMLPSGYD